MPPFSKAFREQNSQRFHWLCVVTCTQRTSVHTLTLFYTTTDHPHLFFPHKPDWTILFQWETKMLSIIRQFQKLVNSWVSAELQLFNTCIQNKTISHIKVLSALQDHFWAFNVLENITKIIPITVSHTKRNISFMEDFLQGWILSLLPKICTSHTDCAWQIYTVDKFGPSCIYAW